MSLKNLLTLSVITRNSTIEIDKFEKMLKSARPYCGQAVVTVTVKSQDEKVNPKLANLLKCYKCQYHKFAWVNDFSKARNHNKKYIKTKYFLWLDTDDILEGGQYIEENIKALETNKDLTSVWYEYHYAFDEDGNCISILPRERICITEWHEWEGRIHENAICKYQHNGYIEYRVKVKHNVTCALLQEKGMRNVEVALLSYKEEKEKGKLDPRTIYDCGRGCSSICQYEAAEHFYAEFLEVTTSPQDYYDVLIRLTNIYIITGRSYKASEAAFKAMETLPLWPDAYIVMGKLALLDQKYDKAIHWLDIAEQMDSPKNSGLVVNPIKYTADLWKYKSDAHWWNNEPEMSLEYLNMALEIKPSDEELKEKKKRTEEFLNFRRAEEGALVLKDFITEENDEDKLRMFVDSLPKIVSDHAIFVRLRNKFHPKSGDKRVVIYCHSSFEPWSPLSIKGGIGGSEEAVIQMSKELSALGWNVEVYNECLKPGMYDGVQWNYYDQFDKSQPCEIFIAWRMWEYLRFAPTDSFKILWCHDKQNRVKYPPNFRKMCDKIFVLSQHHREDIPQYPDEAFYITRNGIVPDQFKDFTIDKDNNKYIYASSPDRGLEVILDHWEKIKEIKPKAELHVFYGFTATYDKLRNDLAGKSFKEKILTQMRELPDVYYHGRVGHVELAEWFKRCGFWLYPSIFTEISCITAMKAMATGCWPITNDFAALAETVKHGSVVKGKMHEDGVIDAWLEAVKNADDLATPQKRQEMINYALRNLSWANLAKDWNERFKEWLIKNK